MHKSQVKSDFGAVVLISWEHASKMILIHNTKLYMYVLFSRVGMGTGGGFCA